MGTILRLRAVSDLSVKLKLIIIVALAFVGLLALSVANYQSATSMSAQGERMQQAALSESTVVNSIRLKVERMHGYVSRSPSEIDLARQGEFEATVKQTIAAVEDETAKLMVTYRAQGVAFQEHFGALGQTAGEVFNLGRAFPPGKPMRSSMISTPMPIVLSKAT